MKIKLTNVSVTYESIEIDASEPLAALLLNAFGVSLAPVIDPPVPTEKDRITPIPPGYGRIYLPDGARPPDGAWWDALPVGTIAGDGKGGAYAKSSFGDWLQWPDTFGPDEPVDLWMTRRDFFAIPAGTSVTLPEEWAKVLGCDSVVKVPPISATPSTSWSVSSWQDDIVDSTLGAETFARAIREWSVVATETDTVFPPETYHRLVEETTEPNARRYVQACGGLRAAVLAVLHKDRHGTNGTKPNEEAALRVDADQIANAIGMAANWAAKPEVASWIFAYLEHVTLSPPSPVPDVMPGTVPPSPCEGGGQFKNCDGATCSRGVWTRCDGCPTTSVEYVEGVDSANSDIERGKIGAWSNLYDPGSREYALYARGYNDTIRKNSPPPPTTD